ncbi:MAG TPA: protein-glutamate O-methyltransferase CheR [Methylococcus sp.]|nr:protein-glutamate O-methyltransferase CheR [Methylococcus sp.]
MNDSQCIAFLQWALPRLGLHWPGFRKVRGQVCKRVSRRLKELGFHDVSQYRAHLERTPGEWAVLEGLCRVTISRFYRDRRVFEVLEQTVLPALAEAATARGETVLNCWSAGCASGEEPYTLSMLWDLAVGPRFPGLDLSILATDVDPAVLQRAITGIYGGGSLKELPREWRERAFALSDGMYRVREEHRHKIVFHRQDLRSVMPEARFHLILCRNLVQTYFAPAPRTDVMNRIAARLVPGGGLVVGIHEVLPPDVPGFEPWYERLGIYRRAS